MDDNTDSEFSYIGEPESVGGWGVQTQQSDGFKTDMDNFEDAADNLELESSLS